MYTNLLLILPGIHAHTHARVGINKNTHSHLHISMDTHTHTHRERERERERHAVHSSWKWQLLSKPLHLFSSFQMNKATDADTMIRLQLPPRREHYIPEGRSSTLPSVWHKQGSSPFHQMTNAQHLLSQLAVGNVYKGNCGRYPPAPTPTPAPNYPYDSWCLTETSPAGGLRQRY